MCMSNSVPCRKIEIDTELLRKLVEKYGARQAARMLGVSVRTVYRRLNSDRL